MQRNRPPSAQAIGVLRALAADPTRWRYGYDLVNEVHLKSGSLYPILVRLADRGLLKRPCQVQFVMGIPNALPPRRKLLEFLISELNQLMPDATWSAAGIGRQQLEVNHWCLELGGHVRTGLEDNIKFDKDRLARSNAELVSRVAELCGKYGRHAASPAEARRILKLPEG